MQLPVIQPELSDPRSRPVLSLSFGERAARWQEFLFALSTKLNGYRFLYMLKAICSVTDVYHLASCTDNSPIAALGRPIE